MIQHLIFDAYGTLFDLNSAWQRHMPRIGDQAQRFADIWRDKQIQYTWLRSLMQSYVDFYTVTSEALDYSFATCGIKDESLRSDLLQAYLELDCHEDVLDTLQALKISGRSRSILSNGNPSMLAAAAESSGLSPLLDHIISADSVQVFKPDPRVYQLALDTLNADIKDCCFVSSNPWDVAGASHFGFQVAWINRKNIEADHLPHGQVHRLSSLHELASLIDRLSQR